MIRFFKQSFIYRLILSFVNHGVFHALASVIFIILFVFSSCVRKEAPFFISFSSDMENLSPEDKKRIATSDSNYSLSGGLQQNSIRFRSGNKSVLSTPENAFTLAIDIPNVYRDSYVEVTAWKQGENAHLVCVLMGTKDYFSVENSVEKDDNGWEKLSLQFYIPPLNDYNQLKFYLWNSGKDTVFYDDISLQIIKNKSFPEFTLPSFHLEMDTSDILSLMETRKRAFASGVLQSVDDDWVSGFVFGDDKMMKAKLRLKGDWLDHLHGSKWSYRVKLKKGNTWNRMKVFSIQNPLSRLGVNEWFLHKFMISEGLLTTRYGFVPVTFNGQNMGLYAWEEHFAKQLLESQKRREGPMVRFVESALWDARVLDSDRIMNNKITPVFDVAVIKPFSSGKVVEDSMMFNQFLIAQNLMMQYRSRSSSASEIFNIEMLAKYFAIADVFLARHSLIWHNQRFYYNPVICKLEPIAYDCYSDIGLEEHLKNPITGFLHYGMTQPDEYIMVRELFNDTLFVDYYIDMLIRYSNTEFLDSVFNSYEQISFYDSLILREYPNQEFFEANIKKNAEEIRQLLPSYVSHVSNMRVKNEKWENFTLVRNDYDSILPDFFAPNLILAYKEKVIGDSTIIRVKNFFTEQITILGIGKYDKKIREIAVPIPIVESSSNGIPSETFFTVSNDHVNYMFFSISSSYELYSIEISQWPEPKGTETPIQKLTMEFPFPDTSIISKVEGQNVYFKNEVLTLNHPVIIPKGYNVVFAAGTNIDLINNAFILSHSPVIMNGTEEMPIVIKSTDFSSNGFIVLQAESGSVVNNVHFENLNTINYNGWVNTGAVTFYESDVVISNSFFYRNQCEDALNIIRSNFTVSDSRFEYIYGDAFDADFCTGRVVGSLFIDIGNDAMDFSGSNILIENTEVLRANDKGISGGEDSKVKVIDSYIRNANIGLASKDLSVVEVLNSKIESCNYGIVLLQKNQNTDHQL